MKTRTASRRTLAVVLLALTLAAAVTGCRGKKEKGAAGPEPVPAAELIPAEDYQAEITTIDRLIFSGDLSTQSRMMLVGNLAALAGRLDVPGRPEAVRRRVQKLRDLAGAVQNARGERMLPQIQGEWVRARTDLFGAREWFSNSREEAMRWPGSGQEPIRGEGEAGVAGSLAPAPPRYDLSGRWVVAEVRQNGEPVSSEESGAVWSFDSEGLTIDRGAIEGRYSYVEYIDSRGPSLRLESTDGSIGGWMLYQFTPAGKLMVSYMNDLNQRPDGFEAPQPPQVDYGKAPAPATSTTATTTVAAADAPKPAGPKTVIAPQAQAPGSVQQQQQASDTMHFVLILDPVQ